MSPDASPQRLKEQLLALQGALGQLRDGLVEMSLLLQELSLHGDDPAARAAAAQAQDLLARLRG